jgi:hypothetical protein
VLDRVGVVQTSHLKEFLEVFRGQLHLTLAAAYGSHNAHHTGATHWLAIATIAIGYGCGLLKTLLAPLPAALGSLPTVLDGDIR